MLNPEKDEEGGGATEVEKFLGNFCGSQQELFVILKLLTHRQ